jgi:hypothetical protein
MQQASCAHKCRYRSGREFRHYARMEHEQPQPRDEPLIALLQERDGKLTRVETRDGSVLRVFNIAWGYDMGDEFAHVTTNVSPFIDGESMDFFWTNDVTQVSDPSDGTVVFPRA